MPRHIFSVAAALFPPLLVRSALLVADASDPGLSDLRGAASDFCVALLFGAAIAFLCRRQRWLGVMAAALWGALHYAEFEHVCELDSSLQLAYWRYLTDPTFLSGSALMPKTPGLLGVLVLVPAALASLENGRGFQPGALAARAAIGALGMALLAALPARMETLGWRRAHFAQSAAASLFESAPVASAGSARADPRREATEPLVEFQRDLAGTPRLPLPRPGTNVLLVVMEGVTGGFVAPIAAAHETAPELSLPNLSELAERHSFATTFLTQQRQTNRGLYALLCGDYPKLATQLAKMTEYLHGGTRRCLPRVLASASYATVYLQAAPLAFMFKDAFMERIGFERVYGDRHIENPRVRTNWGVDDGTLFRRAIEIVDELEAADQPWFLTVLTVGTHHPYVLPPDFEGNADEELAAAFEALDTSVGNFVQELERRGVLDDTLVILTADESRGVHRHGDRVARLMSQNWGAFIALTPSGPASRIDEPYAQSDVALSIVDYLGIEPASTPFIGRSLFRAYDTPRHIYFSNTHKRRTGAVFGRDRLYICNEALSQCEKFDVSDRGLFGDDPVPREFEAGEFDDPAAVVVRSLGGHLEPPRVQEFELSTADTLPIFGIENQRIFDGQNLYVPAGSRIHVDIELKLLGESGSVQLIHVLDDYRETEYARPELAELGVGERLRLHYSVDTQRSIEKLKCRLKVAQSRGANLALHIETARLRIAPIPDAGAGG